jgi:hypothetical protein
VHVGAVRSVRASEALGCDAELVAFRILHHSPAVARDFVFADNRGAETDEFIDG